MQCPQCQHENREDAKFCNECATPLAPCCPSCATKNPSGAKFCHQCAAPLMSSAPDPQATKPDAENRFHALLSAVIGLLQGEMRVTYRRLTYVFGLDDALLEEIREELTFKQLAIDENGKGLVWTGESRPVTFPAVATPSQPVIADTTVVRAPAVPSSRPVPEISMPSNGPTVNTEDTTTEARHGDPAVAPEPIRSAPEAERRQLTVMFCDLADSTKLSQQLDPEDLREVIRAYQHASAEVIQRFDGYIAQHLGDGLLIYFGWPRAHEDDAQRALHAGLGIVEAITISLNPHLEQEYGVQLTVRLGVHTGPVVVGEMGGGGRHENLATGETVNIAARFEGLATPNTVVISHVTARLVRGAFALEELGLSKLKGVVEPVQAFRVLEPLEVNKDKDATTVAGVPFLVGRDEEMGLLLRRWEQSKDGLGQVVLISGEAGIGKSSLVEAIRAHVLQEGLTRVTFRCSPYHTNSALYPVIEHIQRVLHFQRDDVPEVKLTKLEQVLRMHSFPLHEVVPLMAILLAVPLPEGRYPPLQFTPLQQRQQTQDMLVAWMLEEAERQPVLAVWEDLHWADPSTIELLGLYIDQAPTAPMLHLLTFRPELVPPWSTRSHMTPLTLNRLERSQVELVISRLAGGKRLPTEVVEHIVTKTDGVPLYVEELTKMLLESTLLHEETDHFALTGPMAAVTIPTTLYDSLMARLDRLPTVREVAQLGAVLGREFGYELLQALSTLEDATLQHGLAQLVDAELLYQRGRPPRARYMFKHALIQDAAYASLLNSTRQHYHQQIAQLLETQFPEIGESEPELVAHHYTEGGYFEQAIGYWQQAGSRALQRSANAEAIAHLQQGLELLDTLPDTLKRTHHELDMLTTVGPALLVTKGYAAPEVIQAYTRARELCQQIGETPEQFVVLWNLWIFYLARSEHQSAMELGDQCLQLAQRVEDEALLLEAHLAIGISRFYLGQLASARTHLEQTIALYDPHQHHRLAFRYGGIDPGMAGLAYCGWTLWLLGYPDQARALGDKALGLAQHLAHPYTLARTLYYDTILCQFSREWQALREQANAAITVASEQRVGLVLALCPIMRGWAVAMQEQSTEGIVQIRQGLDAYRATGAEFQRPHFLTMLAEASGILGQPEGGLAALDEALTLTEKTAEHYYEAEMHRLKGELVLMQAGANLSEAETCFYQALDTARSQHAKSLELRAAASLARLWQSQDKRQDASDLLAPVYGWFTEGFDTADLQEAKGILKALASP